MTSPPKAWFFYKLPPHLGSADVAVQALGTVTLNVGLLSYSALTAPPAGGYELVAHTAGYHRRGCCAVPLTSLPFAFASPCALLQTFADDIGVLADEEGCDVIVDDVSYLAS